MPREKKLKILHLVYDHPDNPWLGGGGAGRTWFVNEFLSNRHDITVMCGGFPGAQQQDEPFRVRFLGNSDHYILSRIRYIIESRKIEFNHYDLVVEEFSFYAPILSRFKGRPAITILQSRHGLGALKFHALYGWLSLISQYLVLPCRRSVVIVSEHLRPAVSAGAHVALIPQGADIPDDLPPSSEEYVLYLGRLDIRIKGLDTLLQAWSGIPAKKKKLPLFIAGGGDVDKVRSLVQKEGAQDVHLIGRLDHREAIEAINRAAFLCVPSRSEGSPLVVYEALAMGKPVVASAIPAIKGLFPDGVAGIQVPASNPTALSNAVETLLNDFSLRKRLGEGALQVGREFKWENIAKRQESFYFDTISRFTP